MFWYGRADVSMGMAAQIAGLSVTSFMHALKQAGQDTVVVDLDDFKREVAFLKERNAGAAADG